MILLPARMTVPTLMRAWEARPPSAKVFIEDVEPKARAGLLLSLSGGCPASAFEYAYQAAIGSAPAHGRGWMDTIRILARVRKVSA